MSEISRSNEMKSLPEAVQTEHRQDLLDQFSEAPEDKTLWQTAYGWVRAEGDNPEQPGVASSIPAEELIALADKVRTTDPAGRYDLMADRASNGQYWFDVIEGFSSDHLSKVQESVISTWVSQRGSRYSNALDIGTGVGKSLVPLEANANYVTGIDSNQKLLDIAKDRVGHNANLVRASVEELPFDNDSFDLISSQGVSGALNKSTTESFYREIARVMKPDGVYIETTYFPVDEHHPNDELARLAATSKAMLSDMIGDTVSGALVIPESDQLSWEDTQALFEELGLDCEVHDVLSEDNVTHALVTIITKN
jgi:ubiquinone/menaquinone biosynthesis C-methylase UbiE